MGVGVYTMDDSGSTEFPAFFTSKSGSHSPYNCRDPAHAARIVNANWKSGLNTGLLIGVPILSEHSADPDLIRSAIDEALAECSKLNIRGKKITPFLLNRLNQITKGKSLQANLALIKNNVRIAALIAVELSKLETRSRRMSDSVGDANSSPGRVILIGGKLIQYKKNKTPLMLIYFFLYY
jgi:pseudouridine-5'-phosphate glycosidase